MLVGLFETWCIEISWKKSVMGWSQTAAKHPHSCLLTPLPGGMGSKQVRNFVGQDYEILINRGERKNKTNYAKAFIYHLLQVDSCTKKWFPCKTNSVFLLLSTASHSLEYLFSWFGSALLVVFPLSFWPVPDLFTGVGQNEKQRKPWPCARKILCRNCSSIAKIMVCQHTRILVTNPRLSTIWAVMNKVKSIPARTTITANWGLHTYLITTLSWASWWQLSWGFFLIFVRR